MIIDYAPIPECLHPDQTYGEICVQCGECGRFDSFPFVRTDIKVVTQGNDAIPPFWRYPREFGGHYERDKRESGKPFKCWYRSDKKMENGTTLEDIIPDSWYPKRLPYLRWWIEGKNY